MEVCLNLVFSVIIVTLLAVNYPYTYIPNLYQSAMAKDDLTLPCITINVLKLNNFPDEPDVYQKEYKEAFIILCES